jgi:rfaE bifunctional protein kinase chain/domain
MMTQQRFNQITSQYRSKKIMIAGDFCLDRYFEIDPALEDVSLETGLPVYNVVRTRSQPGGAGTVLNNLLALGAHTFPVSACGNDPEGWQLTQLLKNAKSCDLQGWCASADISTFTYNKPLIVYPQKEPRELNRLDIKNWRTTPSVLQRKIISNFKKILPHVDFCVLMQQVDKPETGVLCERVLKRMALLCREHNVPCMGDSRLGLGHFPPMIFKMNRNELAHLSLQDLSTMQKVRECALTIARKNEYPVFVSLAEEGICAATPEGDFFHENAFLTKGPIDVVGAGDAVTANLSLALCSGSTLSEALELAMCAASIVIHKLGTTGTASVKELRSLTRGKPPL